MRFRGTLKPDFYEERPLRSQKVPVWTALSSAGIVGSFFYEEDGKNHNSYVATLSVHSKDELSF